MRDYEDKLNKAIKELETFKIMAKSESGEMAITMAIESLKRELISKLTQQAYEDGKKDGYFQAKVDQALNTGWIPVSEKLPEKNTEVLATTESGYITIAEWLEYDHWFIHEGSSNAHTDELTAWMPLPEPYKTEGNEE